MMNRPRLFPAFFAMLFVAGALAQSASCALDTNGNLETSGNQPCNTSGDCDDQNACTTDTCSDDKLCAHAALADGPLANQVAGDCTRNDCKGGAPLVVNDDTDAPNDNEPCTTDACSGGTPSNTPKADDSSCQRGPQTGTCQMGSCQIACSAANPCNDMNPCTDEYCNAATSVCVFTNIDGLPTPGAAQTDKDCKIQLCVNGIDSVVNDDGDIPIDGNSCTQDVCAAGVPSNPGVTAGEYCVVGQPDVCDGSGQCVACTVAEHCVGIMETDCIQRSCVSNTCQPKYLDQSTTAAAQNTGDCQKNVCNGTDGGTVSIADNTDLPTDNNPCTTDTCNAGAPKFTNVASGTSCGGANVCNATGGCVGCNAPTDCAGTDDFCKQRTCTANVCGFQYTGNNTALPGGNQTAMDCKVVVCDGNGGTKINPDTSDLPADDGNQCTKDICTAQGAPTHPNEALNVACNQNGGDICNGNGACKKSQGKNCAGNAECSNNICADGACCDNTCTGTCRACNVAGKVGTCSNVPKNANDGACMGTTTCDGGGACKAVDGQGCSMGNQCVNANCIDSICCENACGGTCKACNVPGSLGVCSNVAAGGQDSNSSPVCSGSNQCDGAGVCKKSNGQGCAAAVDCLSNFCVDGLCCEGACGATCMACNTGGANNGKCVNVPTGQDDANGMVACTGALNSCNGAGACKGEQGQVCPGGNGDCLNNTCADGYCCDNACGATCKACNVATKEGTCSNVPTGQDDANGAMACTGMNVSCDTGACKKENGQGCAAGTDCLSANCVDTVCCDSGCSGTCKSCNVAGSVGTCSNVAPGQNDNTCMGSNQSCDGMGLCKKIDGQSCSDGMTECQSGFCSDSVCCNEACTDTCRVCNAAGVCGNVANGQDDSNGMPACSGAAQSCNGGGACKLESGEPCMSGSECLSGACSGNPKKCN